jgi:hypothetical protein
LKKGDSIIICLQREECAYPLRREDDDLIEQKLAEDIYRYFGIQPYWTEEGRE